MLAASLATLGQREKATEIMREALMIEPQLTLAKLHARMLGIDEGVWKNFSDGLRLAGLPEK